MDQDMREWIEQQRRLAREGKLPKERLDVLALVDVPFARRCQEEMGMPLVEDVLEEAEEEEEEEEEQDPDYDAEDPDYDAEASDEDLDSNDYTLESSYSYSDSATDSDVEDYTEDWREAEATARHRPRAAQSSSKDLSGHHYGLRRRLFGISARRSTPPSNTTSTERTNTTATVGARKRRREDDAAKTCSPRSLQGSSPPSRRSHSAGSSPLKKCRTTSPDSADDIRPVSDGHNRGERGRRAPTQRGESSTSSAEESRHLAAVALAADADAEEEFSSASDGEAADDSSDPREEMSTLLAKAMYLESILDWV